MKSAKILAPAKINIFLEVLGKRNDGYHEIDTLMSTVNLFDDITIEIVNPYSTQTKIDLACTFEDLNPKDFPCDDKNIAVKAAKLFFEKTHIKANIKINLHKRIPWGAGLGGGSSNAASVLILLNELFETGLDNAKLAAISSEIGSDTAFFFYQPSARCTGRGEIVTQVNFARKLQVVILIPDVFCSTAYIYSKVKIPLNKKFFANIIEEKFLILPDCNFEILGQFFFNRLEEVALEQFDELKQIYVLTDSLKEYYWKRMLSGSGSTIVFYSDAKNLKVLIHKLRELDLGRVFEAETIV